MGPVTSILAYDPGTSSASLWATVVPAAVAASSSDTTSAHSDGLDLSLGSGQLPVGIAKAGIT